MVGLLVLAGTFAQMRGVRADGHPHFDSKGMPWFSRWADALAEAERTGKPILIEYGREA